MSRGRAKLAMGEGLAAWLLEAPDGFGEADFHTHHAIQVSISYTGNMALTCEGETLEAPVVAIATDTPHKFDANGRVGFLFVEPEGVLGRALASKLFRAGSMVAIEEPTFAAAIAPLAETFEIARARMLDIAGDALAAFTAHEPARLPDERIIRVIEQAAQEPELSLDEAAEAAGVYLSPSRLRHLFVEHTGLAFKTYMVWQRLFRALEAYAEGATLTEAAHRAAFADSAHFSRVFRRYFGLPATTLTRL